MWCHLRQRVCRAFLGFVLLFATRVSRMSDTSPRVWQPAEARQDNNQAPAPAPGACGHPGLRKSSEWSPHVSRHDSCEQSNSEMLCSLTSALRCETQYSQLTLYFCCSKLNCSFKFDAAPGRPSRAPRPKGRTRPKAASPSARACGRHAWSRAQCDTHARDQHTTEGRARYPRTKRRKSPRTSDV